MEKLTIINKLIHDIILSYDDNILERRLLLLNLEGFEGK